MDIDVRRAVIANLNGATNDDVRKTITDALSTGEEIVLPGLGVLFELLWKKGSIDQQNQIIQSLVESLQ